MELQAARVGAVSTKAAAIIGALAVVLSAVVSVTASIITANITADAALETTSTQLEGEAERSRAEFLRTERQELYGSFLTATQDAELSMPDPDFEPEPKDL
jgi:hypothetical protein